MLNSSLDDLVIDQSLVLVKRILSMLMLITTWTLHCFHSRQKNASAESENHCQDNDSKIKSKVKSSMTTTTKTKTVSEELSQNNCNSQLLISNTCDLFFITYSTKNINQLRNNKNHIFQEAKRRVCRLLRFPLFVN